MPRQNAKGETEITSTVGNTYTGLHASDGTINYVINDGSTYTGFRHPSGAYNGVITTSRAATRHPNGSAYIILQADTVGYTPVG
jgi:hypothetical protein